MKLNVNIENVETNAENIAEIILRDTYKAMNRNRSSTNAEVIVELNTQFYSEHLKKVEAYNKLRSVDGITRINWKY